MAEAHETLAGVELRSNDGLGPIGRADLEDHVERRAWGAAVQWALERAKAPVMAEITSECVEAITRAVNVEALRPWSETVIR
jgi:hypothetical protein